MINTNKNISYDEYEILEEKYQFTDGDSYKTDNKSYVLLIFNRVLASSSEGEQIIKLELPWWWPLHPFMCFVISMGCTIIWKCIEIKRKEKSS